MKSDDVTMDAWYNGYAEPADMIEAGYDLVSVPDGLTYIVPAAGSDRKRIISVWSPEYTRW